MDRDRWLILVAVVVTCTVALWVRIPLVSGTARYFYHEDDGHHFNHTVEMSQAFVRRGDLNPRYFNKPSLHFYLRIPVVLASVAWARHKGELLGVEELRTRDPRVAELGGYRWTPSHPTVLVWNRALSVALSIVLIILSVGCAALMLPLESLSVALRGGALLIAGLVPALSLEVVRNSHIIGVDILMAVMCLATTLCGVVLLRRWSVALLVFCSLFAGLACSSKYNAAPVVVVPGVAWLIRYWPERGRLRRIWWFLPLMAGGVVFGFLLGTPYAALSPEEFIKGLSYEAWHYRVAGHEGHSAEPGLSQALFYARWLCADGVGCGVAGVALVGAWWLLRREPSRAVVFLSFPVLYAVLMVCQRTNFTRNMVVVVPYVGILAALGSCFVIEQLVARLREDRRGFVAVWCWVMLGVAFICPLWSRADAYGDATIHHTDSRDRLAEWLQVKSQEGERVAVSGRLHLPLATLQLPGVDSFLAQKFSPDLLKAQGYSFIVMSVRDARELSIPGYLTEEFVIPGEEGEQRIPDNPAVLVFRVVSQ